MKRSLVTAIALFSLGSAAVACSDDETSTPEVRPASSPASTAAVESSLVQRHIDVVQRRIAANNAKDWNTWEALHTPNAVRTAPGLPGPVNGAPAMRKGIEELHGAFPDYTLTLKQAFGQGDRLVVRIHQSGTMKGPIEFGGNVVPPTGKRMEQDWVALVRFEGDKIAEFDEFYDNYELLVQLGFFGP